MFEQSRRRRALSLALTAMILMSSLTIMPLTSEYGVVAAAQQDLTTYTEYDPNSAISATSNSIDFTNLPNSGEGAVRKQNGIGKHGGNLTFEVETTGSDVGQTAFVGFSTGSANEYRDGTVNSGKFVGIRIRQNDYLSVDNGTGPTKIADISQNTAYSVTLDVNRQDGTMTGTVYSADRSTLLGESTIEFDNSLNLTHTYGLLAYGYDGTGTSLSGSVRDMSVTKDTSDKYVNPYDDLTEYDEYDPHNELTVSETAVDFSFTESHDGYVRDAQKMDGDNSLNFSVTKEGSGSGAFFIGFTDTAVDSMTELESDPTTHGAGISVGGAMYVRNGTDSNGATQLTTGDGVAGTYFFTIHFDRNNDQMIAEVYSDSDRTNLQETVTLQISGSTDYQYLYAFLNHGDTDTETHTGSVNNIEYSGAEQSAFATSSLSGKVTNQNGQPVSNATVQLYYSTLPTTTEARDQLQSVSDPEPYSFTGQVDESLDIMGDSGLASKHDYYPAIYTPDQMGTAPWTDSADLSTPLWKDVPADEDLTVTIGDSDGLDQGILAGEYARQMYGHPIKSDDGQVVLQRMGADEEPLGPELVYELTEQAGGGWGDPSSLKYAEIPVDALQPGFYMVTARVGDTDYASYIIRVGMPSEVINEYRQDATNELTQQAKAAQTAISEGDIVTKTVATDADGTWSADVPSNAKVVQVQAIKAPGVDVAPTKLTMGNVTDAYSDPENLPNASVYSPSTVKRVDVPSSDVRLTMYEARFPTTANTGALQDMIEDLRNRLENISLADLGLPPTNPEDVRSELALTWNSLRGLLMQYPPAEERYLELSGRDRVPKAEDLSKSELRGEIAAANTALQSTDTTGEVVDDTTERTQDAITQTWQLSGIDLSEANVSVIAEYSNGTRTTVSEEYISVNDGLTADTVAVEDFPLGEDDPAQVNLKLRVAGPSSDIGSDEPVFAGGDTRITNPTFNGNVPDIESIELNTIRPGPDDRVQLSLHASGESSFRQLSNVTVYAPEGTETQASNITNGNTVGFDTSGQGIYQIRYTVEDTEGRQFTDTIRIKADASDEDLKPTVRAHSGPLGTIAMASDGLAGGDVTVNNDGSVSVVAQTPKGETPNEIHVHTTALTTGPETPVTVRVVEGENRQSISEHTYVFVHGKHISDDAITYRNGNQPVTRDDETKWGGVRVNSDGTVIKTWTDQNGVVSVTTNNDPGRLDRLWFGFRVRTAGFDIPGIGVIVPSFGSLAGLGIVAHRRRRNTA